MRARRRFGQHFLETAWVARVLDSASPAGDEVFLEIGPGLGALTLPLARQAAGVVAVEIDRDLAAALTRRAPANVRVVAADFLRIEAAALLAPYPAGLRRRVIGNLAYNVSTPILFSLLTPRSSLNRSRTFTVELRSGIPSLSRFSSILRKEKSRAFFSSSTT